MGEGESFLKLVVDRKRKPAGASRGQPFECNCGSREFVQTTINMATLKGKTSGGTKAWRCWNCKALYNR